MGLPAGLGTYTYVGNVPIAKIDFLGLDVGIEPKDACKLVEKGYNPNNDPCSCQKNVVNDLCSCWSKYSAFYQIGQLSVCTQKAYFDKSRCIQNCSLNACKGGGGGPPQG